MGTKLWDIWAYFRSMEMYTAKRSNENEFRLQQVLYPAKRTAITSLRLHNVKDAYIYKPIELQSALWAAGDETSGDCEKSYS